MLHNNLCAMKAILYITYFISRVVVYTIWRYKNVIWKFGSVIHANSSIFFQLALSVNYYSPRALYLPAEVLFCIVSTYTTYLYIKCDTLWANIKATCFTCATLGLYARSRVRRSTHVNEYDVAVHQLSIYMAK